MSHIAVYKTTLGDVNTDILKKALEILALEDNNLEIRDYIEDYYGKKHTSWDGNKIIGAVFSHDLQKGVGITTDKQGHLLFVSHERGSLFEKMKVNVEQTYKLIVLVTALQEMGYEVSILQETKEVTAIEGSLTNKNIAVVLDDKGNISTDLGGFSGKSCFDEAQILAEKLRALGVNVDAQNLQVKPEGQIETTTHRQRQAE